MLQNLIFYTICLEAKIDISGTGVLPLICISEIRNSMRDAYEKFQKCLISVFRKRGRRGGLFLF